MDLAEGHIKVLEFLLNEREGNLLNLNIGTGKGTTVLELINTFMQVNKVKIKKLLAVGFEPTRANTGHLKCLPLDLLGHASINKTKSNKRKREK